MFFVYAVLLLGVIAGYGVGVVSNWAFWLAFSLLVVLLLRTAKYVIFARRLSARVGSLTIGINYQVDTFYSLSLYFLDQGDSIRARMVLERAWWLIIINNDDPKTWHGTDLRGLISADVILAGLLLEDNTVLSWPLRNLSINDAWRERLNVLCR